MTPPGTEIQRKERRTLVALSLAVTTIVSLALTMWDERLLGPSLLLLGGLVQALLAADNHPIQSGYTPTWGEESLSDYEMDCLRNMLERQHSRGRDILSLFGWGLLVGGSFATVLQVAAP